MVVGKRCVRVRPEDVRLVVRDNLLSLPDERLASLLIDFRTLRLGDGVVFLVDVANEVIAGFDVGAREEVDDEFVRIEPLGATDHLPRSHVPDIPLVPDLVRELLVRHDFEFNRNTEFGDLAGGKRGRLEFFRRVRLRVGEDLQGADLAIAFLGGRGAGVQTSGCDTDRGRESGDSAKELPAAHSPGHVALSELAEFGPTMHCHLLRYLRVRRMSPALDWP